jgi:hypothetical protein
MAAKNQTQKLNDLIEECKESNPDTFDLLAQYVPKRGWYLIPVEPRWFGDQGEYIGSTFQEAAITINLLLG